MDAFARSYTRPNSCWPKSRLFVHGWAQNGVLSHYFLRVPYQKGSTGLQEGTGNVILGLAKGHGGVDGAPSLSRPRRSDMQMMP